MRYTFEWDLAKARKNLRKHRVRFQRAAEIFLDPMAASTFDYEHAEAEERWVTMGKDSYGRVLLLIHTYTQVSEEESRIRIISARKATKQEAAQYKETL
ncbi:MAG: BrnT family toxin [Terriglobia bacterium]